MTHETIAREATRAVVAAYQMSDYEHQRLGRDVSAEAAIERVILEALATGRAAEVRSRMQDAFFAGVTRANDPRPIRENFEAWTRGDKSGEREAICYRCQMRLPERLMTFTSGPRGGVDALCAACDKTNALDDPRRLEVVARRKARFAQPSPELSQPEPSTGRAE